MLDSKMQIIINEAAVAALVSEATDCLEATADALKTEVENAEVVPFKSGALEGSMAVEKSGSAEGNVRISLNTPYARRMYFHPEYNFRKTENANAKGKWFEDWLPGGKNEKFAQETFAKLYRDFTGGAKK